MRQSFFPMVTANWAFDCWCPETLKNMCLFISNRRLKLRASHQQNDQRRIAHDGPNFRAGTVSDNGSVAWEAWQKVMVVKLFVILLHRIKNSNSEWVDNFLLLGPFSSGVKEGKKTILHFLWQKWFFFRVMAAPCLCASTCMHQKTSSHTQDRLLKKMPTVLLQKNCPFTIIFRLFCVWYDTRACRNCVSKYIVPSTCYWKRRHHRAPPAVDSGHLMHF